MQEVNHKRLIHIHDKENGESYTYPQIGARKKKMVVELRKDYKQSCLFKGYLVALFVHICGGGPPGGVRTLHISIK